VHILCPTVSSQANLPTTLPFTFSKIQFLVTDQLVRLYVVLKYSH
jgi:hypothetical protein